MKRSHELEHHRNEASRRQIGTPSRSYQLFFIYTVIFILLSSCCQLPTASALSAPSSSSKTLLAQAISLTKKVNIDPSYADEACALWNDVIKDESLAPFADTMHALLASVLVRVGRDKEALIEYQKSLELLEKSGATLKAATKAEIDIRLGMGKSLQRLLRYDEAREVFLCAAARCGDHRIIGQNSKGEIISCSESIKRAALCSMRLGDLNDSAKILDVDALVAADAEIAGMLGSILLLQATSSNPSAHGENDKPCAERAIELLRFASENSSSPLFHWLYLTKTYEQSPTQQLKLFESLPENENDFYLSLAEVNNSPFDDPDLIHLDDKILLHTLMTKGQCNGENTLSFWPQGFILPEEIKAFHEACSDLCDKDKNQKGWMLKDRAGYGSHGNNIASINNVLLEFDLESSTGQQKEPRLCQKIVNPPMILDGRKFSLRIYVIYFPSCKKGDCNDAKVYLSTEGLAKFASALYHEEPTDNIVNQSLDNQYMTNSGRGDGRSSDQCNLQKFQTMFEENGFDYDKLWGDIEHSVKTVMEKYLELTKKSSLVSHSTIPKILGFDFILDSFQKPWLLEVNRFPGLEPRSSLDSDIKHAVIHHTWLAACKRVQLPKGDVENNLWPPCGYNDVLLKEIMMT